VAPAAGCARTSTLRGLPASLVAGAPMALCIMVADTHGNAAVGGGDEVVVTVDSAAEGAAAVPVEARPPSHYGRLCALEHAYILWRLCARARPGRQHRKDERYMVPVHNSM